MWSSHLAGAQERHAFDQAGRVAKLALERQRVQLHCPRAPTPEPALSMRKVKRPWCPVSFLSWLAVRGFLSALGSLVRFPCPGVFLSIFFSFFGRRPKNRSVPSFGRGASSSSSRREGRRVRRKGTDPRTGPFRHPLYAVFFNLGSVYIVTSAAVLAEGSLRLRMLLCLIFFVVNFVRFVTRDGRAPHYIRLRSLGRTNQIRSCLLD